MTKAAHSIYVDDSTTWTLLGVTIMTLEGGAVGSGVEGAITRRWTAGNHR
eukprot:CAMPEP_0194769906 /NCGR_PEP_ID=MMETSP0323_2-20130528/44624_1 /TAXON_ID=2866 ORGANISM="Crypthecodinium cohnii, Strain Seligo" /NCGR_SAMPLE_ID=MMETSP0323_2 /ASSEMBLY_ACC=CAM_ASM_000346 /LENGTH=49 /DNA_ID=CAMNT_0039703157 /DNA_START=59 /DNA_END=208 /DNA_ORIENTATION=-